MKGSRLLFFVSLAAIGFVIWSYINPVAYNKLAENVGMSAFAHQEPTINVGGCELRDGDTLSFADGLWTTSTGCTPSIELFYGEIAVAYTNATRYTFDVVGEAPATPFHNVLGEGECVWIVGLEYAPDGVRMRPGCTGQLTGDPAYPASYTVDFHPSIPVLAGNVVTTDAATAKSPFSCNIVNSADAFQVVVLDNNNDDKAVWSGDLPDKTNYTHNLPAGEYYVGVTVGDNIEVAFEGVEMGLIITPSCMTTHWAEVTVDTDTTVVITNP